MGTFTLATGFGLLAAGMILLAILSTGFLLITRKIERDKKEEEQRCATDEWKSSLKQK